MLLRYFLGFALFVAISRPVPAQLLWYYVSPYLSTRAVSVLRANGTGPASGDVEFIQNTLYGPVIIQGSVSGLAPGQHRLMIHRFGDLSNGCLSIGQLFNPEQAPNGWSMGFTRAVGDLGTIQVGQNGAAQISLSDSIITLHGRNNVIGRALAIHEFSGLVTPSGNTAPNLGPMVACGVIGLAAEIP